MSVIKGQLKYFKRFEERPCTVRRKRQLKARCLLDSYLKLFKDVAKSSLHNSPVYLCVIVSVVDTVAIAVDTFASRC